MTLPLLPPPWPGLLDVAFECLSSELTSQITDLQLHAQPLVFVEELLRVPLLDTSGGLAVVRKVLPPAEVERLGGLKGAVLFVHGFAQNLHTWHLDGRSLPNYLASLGYDTYCVDLRGQGLSRRMFDAPMPSHPDDYVYGDMPVVVSAVLAHTPCEGVTLVGHSMGGAVCYASAPFLADAGVLDGVVTFAAIFGMARESDFMHQLCRLGTIARRIGLPGEAAVPLDWIAKRLLAPLVGVLDHRLSYLLPFHGWVPGTMDRDLLQQQIENGVDRVTVGVSLTLAQWGVEGYFQARYQEDYVEHFRRMLDVPVLVLTGNADRMVMPEDARQAAQWTTSTDIEFHVFGREHGGHGWGHLDIILGDDAPVHVWPVMADWLDKRCGDARYLLDIPVGRCNHERPVQPYEVEHTLDEVYGSAEAIAASSTRQRRRDTPQAAQSSDDPIR